MAAGAAGAADIHHLHHPVEEAAAGAVGSHHLHHLEEEAVAAGSIRLLAAAGAAVACPTFPSSYPCSKLRNTHACIASAYAAVKKTPTRQTIDPSELTKLAAISIRPAIKV